MNVSRSTSEALISNTSARQQVDLSPLIPTWRRVDCVLCTCVDGRCVHTRLSRAFNRLPYGFEVSARVLEGFLTILHGVAMFLSLDLCSTAPDEKIVRLHEMCTDALELTHLCGSLGARSVPAKACGGVVQIIICTHCLALTNTKVKSLTFASCARCLSHMLTKRYFPRLHRARRLRQGHGVKYEV